MKSSFFLNLLSSTVSKISFSSSTSSPALSLVSVEPPTAVRLALSRSTSGAVCASSSGGDISGRTSAQD